MIAFEEGPNKIKRSEDRSSYTTPGGKLPGVTTILSETKDEESKKALQRWYATNKNAKSEVSMACRRGSYVHQQLENALQELPVKKDLNTVYLVPT
tara:strand:+ start:4908 stop:5195 length:288 start_codon:yes stop_codon:yes gene_type:complete